MRTKREGGRALNIHQPPVTGRRTPDGPRRVLPTPTECRSHQQPKTDPGRSGGTTYRARRPTAGGLGVKPHDRRPGNPLARTRQLTSQACRREQLRAHHSSQSTVVGFRTDFLVRAVSVPVQSVPQNGFFVTNAPASASPSPASSSAAATRPRQRAGAGAALAFLVGLGGTVGAAVTSHAAGPTPPAAEVQAVVAAPTAAVAAPPLDTDLHPVAITAAQQRFVPTPEQLSNARAIVDVGRSMGLPPRAWVIALATALQESSLRNLGHLGARNDHDSLGLFQQRPSAGWGTPEQVTDPVYAATAFYNRLSRVRDWPTMPLTVAAQKVQISAYPNHYAKHESEAGDIIRALYGVGPFAAVA